MKYIKGPPSSPLGKWFCDEELQVAMLKSSIQLAHSEEFEANKASFNWIQ